MRAFTLIAALGAVVVAQSSCSGGEDSAESADAATAGAAGSGGASGSGGTSATGGMGGCILIGCPIGYRSRGLCLGCEPIRGFCSGDYEPCFDLRNGCEAGTFRRQSTQYGCCTCAPIDAGTDAPSDASSD